MLPPLRRPIASNSLPTFQVLTRALLAEHNTFDIDASNGDNHLIATPFVGASRRPNDIVHHQKRKG
jgi:hypothetical protein